jgi:hypothetical protein
MFPVVCHKEAPHLPAILHDLFADIARSRASPGWWQDRTMSVFSPAPARQQSLKMRVAAFVSLALDFVKQCLPRRYAAALESGPSFDLAARQSQFAKRM